MLIPNKFILLYLENLKFFISQCEWKVTKLYSHFTSEQSRFKREFILMNEKSRQTAKNAVKKDLIQIAAIFNLFLFANQGQT